MPGFRNATQGTSTQRGYGTAHTKERARWALIVDAGHAYCQQGRNGSSGHCLHTTRWIRPGTPWALGHTDDRTAYIGPCHADCNQRDGAVRGGRAALAKRRRRTTWHSRTW